MNKAFEKYLVLIGILLLGGYSSLSAHTNLSDSEHFTNQGLTLSCSLADGLAGPVFSESDKREIRRELVAEEVDTAEEEEESNKKLLSSDEELLYGGFTTAIFYALQLGHFSFELKGNTPYFIPHIFTTSYKRYIRFQVFRI